MADSINFDLQIALTTVAKIEDANKIAQELITLRLAACVNIIPNICSFFEWQGSLQNESEFLLVIKTSQGKITLIDQYFEEYHPYQVYELICCKLEFVSQAYAEWIKESLCRVSS